MSCDDFVRGAGPQMCTRSSSLTSDSGLDQATRILGLSVYPPDGVSLRQWLTDLQDILSHHRPPT